MKCQRCGQEQMFAYGNEGQWLLENRTRMFAVALRFGWKVAPRVICIDCNQDKL